MDSVVKVRRSFLNEIRGLLVAFRSVCDNCYRSNCDCAFADEMRRAKTMISLIDTVRDAEEERFYVEHPVEELLRRFIEAIKQANGKPVRSSEMQIKGIRRQRKANCLKILLKRRVIRKITTAGEPMYVLAEGANTNNNTTKGERHGV